MQLSSAAWCGSELHFSRSSWEPKLALLGSEKEKEGLFVHAPQINVSPVFTAYLIVSNLTVRDTCLVTVWRHCPPPPRTKGESEWCKKSCRNFNLQRHFVSAQLSEINRSLPFFTSWEKQPDQKHFALANVPYQHFLFILNCCERKTASQREKQKGKRQKFKN